MAARRRQAPDFSGDLQAEVMAAVWKLGEAKVDDVRSLQPARRRSAYTTIQTVMNRLVDRGLLTRRRKGNAYAYRARYAEADYLTRAIGGRLRLVAPETRQEVLLNLVDELGEEDAERLARYAERVRAAREGEDGG
jgi:predicted transcriptional regulator